MSEEPKKDSDKPAAPPTQRERWVKYGANVVISSIVVIALAVMVTYLAQARSVRIDTTVGGTQSLRPQTIDFIRDLHKPVRVIALYRKLKSDSHEQDYYQPVADLLSDYASKSHDISTEIFDPDADKDRFNRLVSEVTNRYGGEVKGYKAITDNLQKPFDLLGKFAAEETVKYKALPLDQIQDQDTQQSLYSAYLTLIAIPSNLKQLKTAVESDLGQQVPSYKDAVDDVRASFTNIQKLLDFFANYTASLKNATNLPREFMDYAPGASERAAAVRQVLADILKQISHLSELKELNDFRDQLKSQSILVMTESSYKILPFDQVWKTPQASRYGADADTTVKLSFAGEQQISMAIASLTSGEKPLVVFVRPGGDPLTSAAGPDQAAGPFNAVAQRLRDVNFDVKEKDASGQSAMQPQENAPVEATDAEMKKAIWIVLRSPHDSANANSPINFMVAQHLKDGGSVMIMLFPQADSMTDVLSSWGIRPRTDFLILHAAFPPSARRSLDLVDGAMQQSQLIFKLNQYGNHPIARPLDGLDFLSAASVPITVDDSSLATPMLPIAQSPQAWATIDQKDGMAGHKMVFTPKPDSGNGHPQADIENTSAAPLYGAAAAEKPGGGRVVVVGSFYFATSDLVNLPDNDMLEKHGITVARLPGNGEFFVDSVLWLAHKDTLLAISPLALQVARLKDMSPASLVFWRIGVLIVALPGLVIVAGMMVYVRRQDR